MLIRGHSFVNGQDSVSERFEKLIESMKTKVEAAAGSDYSEIPSPLDLTLQQTSLPGLSGSGPIAFRRGQTSSALSGGRRLALGQGRPRAKTLSTSDLPLSSSSYESQFAQLNGKAATERYVKLYGGAVTSDPLFETPMTPRTNPNLKSPRSDLLRPKPSAQTHLRSQFSLLALPSVDRAARKREIWTLLNEDDPKEPKETPGNMTSIKAQDIVQLRLTKNARKKPILSRAGSVERHQENRPMSTKPWIGGSAFFKGYGASYNERLPSNYMPRVTIKPVPPEPDKNPQKNSEKMVKNEQENPENGEKNLENPEESGGNPEEKIPEILCQSRESTLTLEDEELSPTPPKPCARVAPLQKTEGILGVFEERKDKKSVRFKETPEVHLYKPWLPLKPTYMTKYALRFYNNGIKSTWY